MNYSRWKKFTKLKILSKTEQFHLGFSMYGQILKLVIGINIILFYDGNAQVNTFYQKMYFAVRGN